MGWRPVSWVAAAVLLLGGHRPSVSWAAAVAAGIVDETYQHLVIYAGRPDIYLDFNDLVLNAIGATWVVLPIAAGTRPLTTASADRLRPWRAAVFLVAALLLLLWLDPPTFSPFWRRAATGRDYRVLSGAEGLLVAVLLWGVARLGIGHGPGWHLSDREVAYPPDSLALAHDYVLGGPSCPPSEVCNETLGRETDA